MTEDEAKTKWCPFARRATLVRNAITKEPTGVVASGNRFDGEHTAPMSNPLCIASACMAWRTARIGRIRDGDEYATFKAEGYCGLAGAPQ